jgi:hypothetical protein
MKESKWQSRAESPTHDYGIPQRHMGHNTREEQLQFLRDERYQIRWGLAYIANRYQTPCNALAVWMSRADKRGVGGYY